MDVIFPFNYTKAEEVFKNNETFSGGFFPLGENNFWHGGIHLKDPGASPKKPTSVIAAADGDLIAYRIDKDYLADVPPPRSVSVQQYKDLKISASKENDEVFKSIYELPKLSADTKGKSSAGKATAYQLKKSWNKDNLKKLNKILNHIYSNSFALLRHRLTLLNGADKHEVTFYSLSMHLLPHNEYASITDPDIPRYLNAGTLLIDEEKDGQGLSLREEKNKNTVVGIIPKGAFVERLSDEEKRIFYVTPKHWALEENKKSKTEYHFVYVPAIDKYGFVDLKNTKELTGKKRNDHQLYKVENGSDGKNEGIALHSDDKLTEVIRVHPKTAEVFLKKPGDFLKMGSAPKGVFEMTAWKDPKSGIVFFQNGYISITPTSIKKNENKIEYDKTITLAEPIKISSGDTLGYPGKFMGSEGIYHFEIFFEKIDFMDKFSGDKDWRKVFPESMRVEEPDDLFCDSKKLITEIEDIKGSTKNSILSKKEIEEAVKHPDIGPKLRQRLCKHPSEWSPQVNDSIKKRLQTAPWNYNDTDIKTNVDFIASLQWWSGEIEQKLKLPSYKNIWFVHPVCFIDHLMKCADVAKVELVYSAASPYIDEEVIAYKTTPDDKRKGTAASIKTNANGIAELGKFLVPYQVQFPQFRLFKNIVLYKQKLYYSYKLKVVDIPDDRKVGATIAFACSRFGINEASKCKEIYDDPINKDFKTKYADYTGGTINFDRNETTFYVPLPEIAPGKVTTITIPAFIHMYLDADRDGIVDKNWRNLKDWKWGRAGRGAVMLCNNDDDDYTTGSAASTKKEDNSDNKVNKNNDKGELAPLVIRRDEPEKTPPKGWTLKLKVDDRKNIRIFPKIKEGEPQVIGPDFSTTTGKEVYDFSGFDMNFSKLPDKELRLGIEAIRYAGIKPSTIGLPFSGGVVITLSVKDSAGKEYTQEATVRVAPWIMPNHMEEAKTVFVVKDGFNTTFRARLNTFVNSAGCTLKEIPVYKWWELTSGDIFYYCTTYSASFPPMTSFPVSVRDIIFRTEADFIAAWGPGWAALSTTYQNNIKDITIKSDIWMQDCMEIGYSNLPGHTGYPSVFRSPRNRPLRLFPKIELLGKDFGYLEVGSLFPESTLDSNGNLEVTPPVKLSTGKEYPLGRIYYGPGYSPGTKMDSDTIQFLKAQKVQEPIEINTDWLSVKHVDEFITFIPDSKGSQGFKLLLASPRLALKILYDNKGKGMSFLVLPPTFVKKWGPLLIDDFFSSGITKPHVVSYADIKNFNIGNAAIGDTAVVSTNDSCQKYIQDARTRLVNGLGLKDPDDIIEVPIVFLPNEDTPTEADALTGGMVNMLVINSDKSTKKTCCIVPKPYGPVNSSVKDLFEEDLTGKVDPTKVEIKFLSDWDEYHVNMGEVHCGTNTLRKRTAANWWEFEP